METVNLYEAIVRFEWQADGEIKKRSRVIGAFKNEKDAQNAIKIYEAVYKGRTTNKFTCKVDKKSFLRNYRHTRYFKNLDKFMRSDFHFIDYMTDNNLDTAEKVIEKIDSENKFKNKQDKKEFDRIIDRMIRHYQYRLKIDKATGTDEKTIEEMEENVQFLEKLRDGKIELK